MAESRRSLLQEESFESETQLDLPQAENVLVDQHKEKERCDIAVQTDEVSSYVASYIISYINKYTRIIWKLWIYKGSSDLPQQ